MPAIVFSAVNVHTMLFDGTSDICISLKGISISCHMASETHAKLIIDPGIDTVVDTQVETNGKPVYEGIDHMNRRHYRLCLTDNYDVFVRLPEGAALGKSAEGAACVQLRKIGISDIYSATDVHDRSNDVQHYPIDCVEGSAEFRHQNGEKYELDLNNGTKLQIVCMLNIAVLSIVNVITSELHDLTPNICEIYRLDYGSTAVELETPTLDNQACLQYSSAYEIRCGNSYIIWKPRRGWTVHYVDDTMR
jgi:hypothetical protein